MADYMRAMANSLHNIRLLTGRTGCDVRVGRSLEGRPLVVAMPVKGTHGIPARTFTPPSVVDAYMTASAFLSVAPVVEGSMAAHVADAVAALEDYDVNYETTPMGTLVEASDAAEVFAAAQAAHDAVDADRVSTFLKIDDKRTSANPMAEKVAAVEAELGHPARSDR